MLTKAEKWCRVLEQTKRLNKPDESRPSCNIPPRSSRASRPAISRGSPAERQNSNAVRGIDMPAVLDLIHEASINRKKNEGTAGDWQTVGGALMNEETFIRTVETVLESPRLAEVPSPRNTRPVETRDPDTRITFPESHFEEYAYLTKNELKTIMTARNMKFNSKMVKRDYIRAVMGIDELEKRRYVDSATRKSIVFDNIKFELLKNTVKILKPMCSDIGVTGRALKKKDMVKALAEHTYETEILRK